MSTAMSGKVQTVLGSISKNDLGLTVTHEHLLIDFKLMFDPPLDGAQRDKAFQPVNLENLGWVNYYPFRNLDNLELLDEKTAVDEVLLFKSVGGGTIVEATTFGIGRNPEGLRRIAMSTDVNIIMGAGYYVDAVHPEDISNWTDSEIAHEIILQLTSGFGDTGIQAGIIGELGCSWPLTENERKVLRGSAQAQVETGASILIHPGRNPEAPFEILDVLIEAGADISRVVMGHLDRTIADQDTLLDLAQRGSYLEFDLFGWEVSNYPISEMDMPNDAQRINFIQRLIAAGHRDQIVVAHDICCKSRLAKYGGHGYSHIIENIVPRMRLKALSEVDIRRILVDNPAQLLTLI